MFNGLLNGIMVLMCVVGLLLFLVFSIGCMLF